MDVLREKIITNCRLTPLNLLGFDLKFVYLYPKNLHEIH